MDAGIEVLIVRQTFCFSFVFNSGYYSFPITRITGRVQRRRAAAILVAAHTTRFVTTAVAFGAVRLRYQRFPPFDSIAPRDRLRIQVWYTPRRGAYQGKPGPAWGFLCAFTSGAAFVLWGARVPAGSAPLLHRPRAARVIVVGEHDPCHSPGYFSMRGLAPNFCGERRYHLVFITPATTSVAYRCFCRKVVETAGLLMDNAIGKQWACRYLSERFANRAGTG
jgi:hypothetical protein